MTQLKVTGRETGTSRTGTSAPVPVLMARLIAAGVAVFLIGVSLYYLLAPLSNVSLERTWVGRTPVSIYRPNADPGPVVVISHGFAGSRPIMQNFALTLARNGYTVVTYELLGHGVHPDPLSGDLGDVDGASLYLLEQLDEVVSFARGLNPNEPRIALLGHSIGTIILVRYAAEHPDIAATVTVSLISNHVTETTPPNLLALVGAWEQPPFITRSKQAVAMVAGSQTPTEGVTYGHLDDGTARRYVLIPEMEHITVLFSKRAAEEATQWIDDAFGRPHANVPPSVVPGWLGLLLVGSLLLAWPLSTLLPRVAPTLTAPRRMSARTAIVLAVFPSVLTPIICRFLPTDFLTSLLGDYLIAHCLVYGLLTILGLWIIRKTAQTPTPLPTDTPAPLIARALAYRPAGPLTPIIVGWPPLNLVRTRNLLISATIVTFFLIFAIALPVNEFVTAVVPQTGRAWTVQLALWAALPFFLADETLVRSAPSQLGTAILTRVMFVASLGLAILLNFNELFFLMILMPLLIVFMFVYSLISWYTWRATGHVAVGATASSVGLALLIGAAFPVVGG